MVLDHLPGPALGLEALRVHVQGAYLDCRGDSCTPQQRLKPQYHALTFCEPFAKFAPAGHPGWRGLLLGAKEPPAQRDRAC
jgi:hypothetical protein